ncbi:MAG TPA: MarC family NAAT transporter [Gammaproteobacteria bacterium]|nr:MarC family NAAT transporter [Gammaproteobacteria bacterium]
MIPIDVNFAAELFSYVLSTIGALLPIVNPFAAAPMVVSMTAALAEGDRRDQVRRACIYMFCILAAFLVAGGLIMQFLGISIPGLRVAGGLVIAAVGFRMLFLPQPSTAYAEQAPKQDISFTPLAIPSLAGPGSIAVVIGMSTTAQADRYVILRHALIIVGIAITSVVCYFVLRGATTLARFLGPSGMSGLTGIMGFLLVCIGVQFVINGVTNLVGAAP